MGTIKLRIQFLIGKLRRIFFMALPENEKDYQKSRKLYIVSDTASQMLSGFAGGVFLVTLMSSVGITEGNIGIILSMGELSSFFQLSTMNYIQHLLKFKLFICMATLQKVWFAFIYFIPFFSWPNSIKAVVLMLCYFTANICIRLGTPPTNDWLADLVPSNVRGRFFARKEGIAVFFSVLVSLIMGIMLDYYKNTRLLQGFVITGTVILFLAIVNVVSIIMMKEPKTGPLNEQGKEIHGRLAKRLVQEQIEKCSVFEELKQAFHDVSFLKILILNCMWMTAYFVAMPFNFSYQLNELKLSYTYITVIGFGCSLLRIFITPTVGKEADKAGMAKTVERGMILVAIHYLVMVFAKASNGYITYTLATIFSCCAWAYTGIGFLGIQLEFFDKEKRVLLFSLFSAISGLYGFLVSFVTGKLLDWIQKKDIFIGNVPICAQQITNFMGFCATVGIILYIRTMLEKKDFRTPLQKF